MWRSIGRVLSRSRCCKEFQVSLAASSMGNISSTYSHAVSQPKPIPSCTTTHLLSAVIGVSGSTLWGWPSTTFVCTFERTAKAAQSPPGRYGLRSMRGERNCMYIRCCVIFGYGQMLISKCEQRWTLSIS